MRAWFLLIIISIDKSKIFRTYILDLADEYLSRDTYIDVHQPITIDYRSIFFDICFECEDLILEIRIDIYIFCVDQEILKSKEDFSSIVE